MSQKLLDRLTKAVTEQQKVLFEISKDVLDSKDLQKADAALWAFQHEYRRYGELQDRVTAYIRCRDIFR